jgi:hypothetical protein
MSSERMKETKELIFFICELASALDQALEDNSVGLGDLSYFFGALSTFGMAFEDCKEAINELKNMTEEDKLEIETYVNDNFDLKNDNIEKLIESAIKIALELMEFVNLYSTMKIIEEE